MRRKNRVFYRISKLLRKRTPDQCRSHHQKLFNKHKGNIDEVIKEISGKTYDKTEITMGENKTEKLKKTSPWTLYLLDEQKTKEACSEKPII